MKKLLVLLLLGITAGCNGQDKKDNSGVGSAKYAQNKPQVNWKVNKKYDDKGNLISYDSTYTWSYSSKDGTKHNIDADTVMAAFKKQFNTEFPSFFNSSFGNPIWSDSLFSRDFAAPDYFMKKWESHYFDMHDMMRRMDSLRNSFLDQNYPGLNKEGNKVSNTEKRR